MTLSQIMVSVRHGFRGVLRFSGREGRTSFWPYAIFVVLVAYAAGTMLVFPVMFDAMMRTGEMIEAQRQAGGAAAPAPELVEQAISGMTEDVGALWLPYAILEALAIALLAAAVTRRFHDFGWRGWWGWLPVPFLAIGLAVMPVAMEFGLGRRELSGTESWLFAASYLSWVALALLALLLARRGDEAPNRFGPPPPL